MSLRTLTEEVEKLRAVRAVGLPAGLFVYVAPRVLAGWRARAAAEAPSHLREHPRATALTLLAALLVCREREITDTLVDLLIAKVQRISARAERRAADRSAAELRRVSGKEAILFRIVEAALANPDGLVRDVVYPDAGGQATLDDLLGKYRARGTTFRRGDGSGVWHGPAGRPDRGGGGGSGGGQPTAGVGRGCSRLGRCMGSAATRMTRDRLSWNGSGLARGLRTLPLSGQARKGRCESPCVRRWYPWGTTARPRAVGILNRTHQWGW